MMTSKLANTIARIPRGAGALFFIQIFATLGYSVLYSVLVLFAIEALKLPAAQANSIIATFVAFNFALHLLGGFLGGRLLSFRGLFLLGMILQIIGCLLIAQVSIHFLYVGMAFFLAGAGMNVPCINCMITQLFEPDDKRRQTTFLWNYSGMNIGFFAGFSVAGYFQITHSFHTLFLLTSVGNVIALCLLLVSWKKLYDVKTHLTEAGVSKVWRAILGMTVIGALVAILCVVLAHAALSSELIMTLGVVMVCVILYLACTQKTRTARRKMFAYYIFAFSALIFFVLYQLAPMALTLFLERNVDRHVLGFTVPTEWFLNIDAIVVMFGCPLFAHLLHTLRKKGRDINTPLLFAIGLILIGVAIIILPLGIHYASATGMTSAWWILLAYTLLAVGEVALSPVGYAVIGELAPPKLRGLLMGTWLMTVGVAATLSKVFSNMALGKQAAVSPLISNASYSHTFFSLGLFAIIAGAILFLIKSKLLKLMHPAEAAS